MATPVAASVLRRTLVAGAALAALGTGALATQDAQAAFTLARCQGADGVVGRGASFQNTLHTRFKTFFESPFGCAGTPAGPTYTSTGSGDGRAAMGAGGGDLSLARGQRLLTVSFGTADEAPTPAQMQLMNDGPTAATSDDGRVRVIPIATGASAFILHVPEGCVIRTVTNKTNGSTGALGGVTTGDAEANLTQRIRVRNELVEAAFAGEASAATWGDIAPGITGIASGVTGGDQTNAGVPCDDVPVRRIVRQDSSGTTYGWKAYLDLIEPTRRWTTTYGTTNTIWPAAGGEGRGTVVVGIGEDCRGADRLCSARDRGGGQLARAVAATDGSIGYVDLATARSNGFDVTPDATATRQDYTSWSPLEVIAGPQAGTYAEPTYAPAAHTTTNTEKGASCDRATISVKPDAAAGDPTFGDWSGAYAAGGNAYPACVVTYVMAWDDNAPVYGNSPTEEAKARTVKDYLGLIVSGAGQAHLLASDYSALPNSAGDPIATWAQNAVAAIDWNKTSGGGGNPNPPVPNPPAPTPPTPNPPAPNPPAAPSNVFSVPSSKSTASLITFSVQLPGAGALKAEATTRVGRRTIKVATISASARGSGRVTLRLKLSSAAKKALARAKGKKLKVAVKFTFTPTGGTANTVTRTVTVKAAARRAARRKAKR